MFCSQCGFKINQNYKYCPSCGADLSPPDKLSPSPVGSLENSGTQKSIPPVKKKPMPFWFKALATLAVLALIGVTAGILFTESLVDVIDHQLDALHSHDVSKAYYAYTSRAFQEATSFDEYKEFVKAYPIFMNSQSAHFTQRSIRDNIGILKGNLTSNEHVKVPVEYKLIREDGKWKILSIRLLQAKEDKSTSGQADPQALVDLVKAQLQYLEANHLTEAYNKYSATEFKEATSESDFKDFINRYPILTNHTTVSFHKPSIRDKGVSTISAIVHSHEMSAYLKYYLVRENDSWKIWSMRILSPNEEENKSKTKAANEKEKKDEMVITDIKLGTKVDENGTITDPAVQFKSDDSNIYVNAEIANGVSGETIHLDFRHLDSRSSILAKASIEENGDTMLMSVFTPPSEGWPKGHYQLTVSSSAGISKTTDFEIE